MNWKVVMVSDPMMAIHHTEFVEADDITEAIAIAEDCYAPEIGLAPREVRTILAELADAQNIIRKIVRP